MSRKPPPPRPNPALRVALILSGVVLLALFALVLLRRSSPPAPRPAPPAAAPAPAPGGPLSPVYGGGAPPGRPRTGF